MNASTILDPGEQDPRGELRAWAEQGFAPHEAVAWRRARVPMGVARAWRAAGVETCQEALSWRAAGASPHTVGVVQRAGLTAADLARWAEAGYGLEDAVRRHLAAEIPVVRPWYTRLIPVGLRRERLMAPTLPEREREVLVPLVRAKVPPAIARAYVDAGWSAVHATAWAPHVPRPADALVYRELGLSPRAAADLPSGTDAAALLRAWWDSGIPRRDVGAWLGAGFSPEEASDAIRAGSTVEAATALRALRG